MNRAQRRTARSSIRTWTISQAYEACPFRSLVSIVPGTKEELLSRVGAAFAAMGGQACPIDADHLADLVDTVMCGQTVIVMGNRADLRDAAKSQLMMAVGATRVGAVGSA